MSYYDYDDWDSGRDEYNAEVARAAIEEFQTERLQSFYKSHLDLALKPIEMAKESRSALEQSPSATLTLAVASIEVGLKAIIVRPIISGLVHEESFAALVTDIFAKNTKTDGVLKITDQVLQNYASIDLQSVILPNHAKSYRVEIGEAQELRNAILHRAERCSRQDAERVLDLAEYLWSVIFLAIIKGIGLHTHDQQTICAKDEASCRMKARIEEMKQKDEKVTLAEMVRVRN
jgi:hypothetical protein